MPIYEFKCPADGQIAEVFSQTPGEYTFPTCECGETMRRKFSFALPEVFQEHYNMTVGEVVTSKSDMAAKLRRKSDEASERTGISSSFSMVEARDVATPAALEQKSRQDLASGRRDAKLIL